MLVGCCSSVVLVFHIDPVFPLRIFRGGAAPSFVNRACVRHLALEGRRPSLGAERTALMAACHRPGSIGSFWVLLASWVLASSEDSACGGIPWKRKDDTQMDDAIMLK